MPIVLSVTPAYSLSIIAKPLPSGRAFMLVISMGTPSEEEKQRIINGMYQDLPSYSTKDPAKYFGKEGNKFLHNDMSVAVRTYMERRIRGKITKEGKPYKIGDIHKYALVKHYKDYIPQIQAKLIETKKVVPFTYKGEVRYRNAESEWTKEEENTLKTSYLSQTDKEIAKSLGRSKSSIKHHRQRLGLKKVS